MSRLVEETSLSSTVADNSSMVVDQAEKAFLNRSFKRALHLSNQFLLEEEEQKQKQIAQSPQGIIKIHIPCTKDYIFPWDRVDMKAYELMIDITRTRPDPRDRALAVALQSWFEISGITQEDGKDHLIPFCRALTGPPVTFELLLILLRFYMQMGQPGWSIYVATACLNQCRWSPQLVRYGKDVASRAVLKEISEILFVELLPFHPHAIRSSVERLNCENTTESQLDELKNDLIWKSTPSRLRKESLEALISSMDPGVILRHGNEAEWFKTSLQTSLTKWKTLLIHLEKEEEENRKKYMAVRVQKQLNPSLLLSVYKQFETQSVQLLRQLKGLLLRFQMTRKSGVPNYKLASAAAAFGFAVLAYRYHRRKLLALLRAAIYEAVVQRVKEIVEALKF